MPPDARSLLPERSALTMTAMPPTPGQPVSFGFSPDMTRSAAIATVAKLLPHHGVPRDFILGPRQGPTDWFGPPPNVFMTGIVRNGHEGHVPVEFLVHDHKRRLISYSMTAQNLFKPGRLTLGLYNNGERVAPVPPAVLRGLATRLGEANISAHLPPAAAAAPDGADEAKAEDFDITALVGAAAAPAGAAAAPAGAMPAGLIRVAPYTMTEHVLGYLKTLGIDGLKELRALDWGFTPTDIDAAGLGEDTDDWLADVQSVIADARAVYAAAPAAAAPVAARTDTTSLHDGGADLTLRLADIRRVVQQAPWIDDASEPLGVSSLSSRGKAALRAQLRQDAELELLATKLVADFAARYPRDPMVADLKSALACGDDDRWARACDRYSHGGLDIAFQTAPVGVLKVTALCYCFSASKGGDRADRVGDRQSGRRQPADLHLVAPRQPARRGHAGVRRRYRQER